MHWVFKFILPIVAGDFATPKSELFRLHLDIKHRAACGVTERCNNFKALSFFQLLPGVVCSWLKMGISISKCNDVEFCSITLLLMTTLIISVAMHLILGVSWCCRASADIKNEFSLHHAISGYIYVLCDFVSMIDKYICCGSVCACACTSDWYYVLGV